MLEFEQLKLRLEGNEAELRDLKDALGYDRLKNEIEELEAKTSAPGFWDDTENSQKILQKTGKLKNTAETYEKLCSTYDDLSVLIDMGNEEEDLSLVDEITESLNEFENGLAALRLQTLLTGEYDNNNAILTPGPAAPRLWTGYQCLCVCIRAGANATALRCNCLIFLTVTKPVLKAPPS